MGKGLACSETVYWLCLAKVEVDTNLKEMEVNSSLENMVNN